MNACGVMSEPKQHDTNPNAQSDRAAKPSVEELIDRLAPDVDVVLASMPPPPRSPEADSGSNDRA